jgi:hypothetical protein
VTCHQTDYNNATTPVAHAAAGFPTTCDTCHDTVLWTDGKFDHTTTGFPLTNSHTVPPRACTDCHVSNNYSLNSTLCYTCHQTDYNGTTNPAHSTGVNATFFPIAQCGTCHSVSASAWTGATFPHTNYTQFPVTHGNANGQCSTCHINGSDYSVFQCTGCHGNNNAANFQHPNVNGYVYNSVNCYQCHASGNGG